jgi:AhpD family alkylhydroperoxidase
MSKNYPEILKSTSANLRELRKEQADVMAGFSALTQAAHKEVALDKKAKELISLAISAAIRCDACIGFHAEALAKLGASRAEVAEAMGVVVQMQGGPGLMYAADALAAFDQMVAARAG